MNGKFVLSTKEKRSLEDALNMKLTLLTKDSSMNSFSVARPGTRVSLASFSHFRSTMEAEPCTRFDRFTWSIFGTLIPENKKSGKRSLYLVIFSFTRIAIV